MSRSKLVPVSPVEKHVWGVLQRMQVGDRELLEAGMLSDGGNPAALRRLQSLCKKLVAEWWPERSYKPLVTEYPGVLAVQRNK